jgi:hypothetical protein
MIYHSCDKSLFFLLSMTENLRVCFAISSVVCRSLFVVLFFLIEQINDSIYVLYYYIKVQEKCEYTKWVIRSRYSQDRQYRGKMRKNRKTNNDLQTTDDIAKQTRRFSVMERRKKTCQRHIVLWMWINHVNVTLFYECGSIMSTSHCSMNMDQSCHNVTLTWLIHIHRTNQR